MRIKSLIKTTKCAVTLSLSKGVRLPAHILRQAQYDIRKEHLFEPLILINMKFSLILSFLISVFILQSCSHGKKSKKDLTQQATETVSPKENILKGQIINPVICKSDSSQSYALYLPSTYTTEKKYPIIFALDAHGDGHLPVSLYKDLAEQYGYIIVGSNNSKNGTAWEESQNIVNKLFTDAGNRLSVNTQRIYLLGFSGGARVANAITISDGSIAGVICCGAAAPVVNSNLARNNYTFLGIVGNEDFNLIEMKKYDMIDLAGHNVKHALITFDGKHEWPAKNTMDEAFWWLELNEMRKNSAVKNDSLIAKHLQPLLKQMELYQQKKQLFETYNLCRKTINFYDGLADLSSCFAIYKSLQSSSEIDKELKQEEANWTEEETLKQSYMKAMQTSDFAWWAKDIKVLNQKIKVGKDKNKVLMYKRILGFLILAAYMQTSGALKQNILPAADYFSKIYVLVDPTNNEAHYLTASIYAKEGKTKEAIKSLNDAVKNGFKDVERLKGDDAFTPLKNDAEFLKVVNSIKK